jgi:ssDNA-specific exonuclease RecJ
MQKGKIHHYARIEKILIDLLADVDLFATYQELELTNIYENIFRKYKINEDALLRYAGRRSSREKLEKFITKKTNIKIREFVERN